MFIIFFIIPVICAQNMVTEIFNKGMAAYESKDYKQYLECLQKLDSLRPYHPVIKQKLTGAFALNGKNQEALNQLISLLMISTDSTYKQDPDIQSLLTGQNLQQINHVISSLNKTVHNSQLGFTINEIDLHPEGITYDSKRDLFYISSIRKHKIIWVDRAGNYGTVVDNIDGNDWSFSGIAMHNGMIWSTFVAAPQMQAYDSLRAGKSGVIKINPDDYSIQSIFQPEDEIKHWFGDLIVDDSGQVYISDSIQPTIYYIDRKTGKILPLIENDNFRSVQGICFNHQQSMLFVADYANGIFVINLDEPAIEAHFLTSALFLLKGIDGLYWHENHLIGIQNGVIPKRLISIKLNQTGDRVLDCTFLENANPQMNEPTLGVVIDDELWFVANSPWPYYDRENNLNIEAINAPMVWRITLN